MYIVVRKGLGQYKKPRCTDKKVKRRLAFCYTFSPEACDKKCTDSGGVIDLDCSDRCIKYGDRCLGLLMRDCGTT
jgi:hypothetical protein